MEGLFSLKQIWGFFTFCNLKILALKKQHYIRKREFDRQHARLLTLIKIIFLYLKIYFP